MFLLFGTRPSASLLAVVTFVCGYCGQSVPQQVSKISNKFTLFFIPLFSFSTRHEVQCTNCGGITALTQQQAENSVAWAASRG